MTQLQQKLSADSPCLHSTKNSSSLTQSCYQQARLAVQQGKLTEAIPYYQQTLKDDPQHLIARQELGNVFLNLKQWHQAISCYRHLLEIDPNLPQIHHNLGEAYTQLEQWSEATSAYQQAIKLQPDFSWSYNNLGDIFLQQEQWSQAIVAYTQAIQLNPDFSWSYHNLGKAYLMLQQWSEAVTACQKAIKLGCDSCWSYYNLAEAFFHQQNWSEAITAYRQALGLEKDLPQAKERLNYATHQQIQSQLGWAQSYYWKAIEQNPDNIELYHKALELEPTNAELHLALGKALQTQGEFQAAVKAYEDAINFKPDFAESYGRYCEVLTLVGREAEALEARFQGLTLEPNWATPEEHLALGNQLEEIGKLEQAIICYQRVLKLNPNWVEAYNSLGKAYIQQQQWEKAIDCYQKAIELKPDGIEFYWNLGIVYAQFGDRKKVWDCFDNIERIDANFGDIEGNQQGKDSQISEEFKQAILDYRQGKSFPEKESNFEGSRGYILNNNDKKYSKNGLNYQGINDGIMFNSGEAENLEMIAANGSNTEEFRIETAENYLKQGDALRKEGKWKKARECYQKVVDLEPNNWLAHHYIGDCLLSLEQYEEAIESYQHCLEINTDFIWSYYNIGVALFRLGKITAAFDYHQKIIEHEPEFWELNKVYFKIQHEIGDFFFEQEDWDKAITAYRRAITLNPKSHWSYCNLGRVFKFLKQNDEAISCLQKSINLEQYFAYSYYHLAEVFLDEGLQEKAVEAYKSGYAITPNLIKNFNALHNQFYTPVDQSEDTSIDQMIIEKINNTDDNNSSFKVGIIEIELGGLLKGWIVNQVNPEQEIKLTMVVDGKQIAKVQTRQTCINFKDSKVGDKVKEFKVQLPFFIGKKLLLDGEKHTFEFIPDESYDQNTEKVIIQTPIPRRAIGSIEAWEEDYLKGWAVPDEHFKIFANLDIYIDGLFYSEYRANLSRSDLLKHNLGSGKNGFKMPLPLSSRQREKHKVDVFFRGTKIHLRNSPFTIESSSIKTENSNHLFFIGITHIELGGILKGWAIDNANPGQTVELKILVDGHLVGKAKTSSNICTDLTAKCLADFPKEFQIRLPYLINNLLLFDNQEHLFEFIPINSKAKEEKPIIQRFTVPKVGVGNLEKRENNIIRGWAVPNEHFGKHTNLDVYINGIFYTEIKANLSRSDLLKYNLGSGKNGFEITLPKLPEDNEKEEHEIDIYFSGTKQSLHKTPVTVKLADSNSSPRRLKRFNLLSKLIPWEGNCQKITIVIPIFNAYEEVKECVASVLEYTTIAARLLLVNDASTDERIVPLLDTMKEHSNVEAITNEENLGYTRTINKGIQLAENDDVVLLNSDTIVGPRWLQNLWIAAYHDLDIGTVTAISDNAGAFSVPSMGQANEFPAWLNREEMVRAVMHNSQVLYPEAPTGSGFCLYIRRALLNDIGLFDQDAFPRGYGEENDFCMRAVRAGWHHIVDDRTLVYHVRSASFRGEKKALLSAGRKVVDERYPEYKALTTAFIQSESMNVMRYLTRKMLVQLESSKSKPRPRILYVIATKTGGTPQTNRDLMNGLKTYYHTMVLHCDSYEVTLYDTSKDTEVICEQFKLDNPLTLIRHQSTEYDQIVSDILVRYSIEILHIRHIAWHSLSLPRIARQLGISVIFSFHDFYTVCPTVNLLDENLTFCEGHCTASKGDCSISLWQQKDSIPQLKHKFIKTWRTMVEKYQFYKSFISINNHESKIFICGCPRSGTSALVKLLNSHPAIAIGMERYKFYASKHKVMQINQDCFNREAFFAIKEDQTNINWKEFYDDLKPKFSLDNFIVGDKYPSYYKFYNEINQSFELEDKKWIFMLRDIADVAASYNVRAANPKDQ